MINNVLIVGGNFNNKGAQSMLFITVDEFKKMGVQNIYFSTCDLLDMTPYTFKAVFLNLDAQRYALSGSIGTKIKCFFKECGRFFSKKNYKHFKYRELSKLLPQIDLMVDISGYNIGKKWSIAIHERYLNNIRLAKKYNIPIFLMPQSFGNFDYEADKAYLLDSIKKLFMVPEIIFAREQQGFIDLKTLFQLSNVQLSNDLVLQNSGIVLENIYNEIPKFEVPSVGMNAVGIIPNRQCFLFGNKECNMKLYESVIRLLLEQGKEVYIFRHSKEDLEICENIYSTFHQEEKVHILTNDFNCVEYDMFVKQFNFIICSRYHGIVHAYRNCVPAILAGWEVKYLELARNLKQEQYVFDITDPNLDIDHVLHIVKDMVNRYLEEQKVILEGLSTIQKNNCFQELSDWMENNKKDTLR